MEKLNIPTVGREVDNSKSFKTVEDIEGQSVLKKIKSGDGAELILLGDCAVKELDENQAENYMEQRFDIDIEMLINIIGVVVKKELENLKK